MRLYNFALQNDLILDRQFGFVKSRGTTKALPCLNNLNLDVINQNEAVIATFLEFSKAFKTADHPILLSKMEVYGVRGVAYDLIASTARAVQLGYGPEQLKIVGIGVRDPEAVSRAFVAIGNAIEIEIRPYHVSVDRIRGVAASAGAHALYIA